MDDFTGLGPLQDRYYELIKSVGKDVTSPDQFNAVLEFVKKAVATGRRLDAPEDRAAAQNFINYWVSRVASATRLAERGQSEVRSSSESTPRFADTVLAPFSESILEEVSRKAEQWLQANPNYSLTARRLLLRLARLQPDGTTFETLPNLRSAFFDFAEPEEVNAILQGLEETGAIRIVRGLQRELDSVVLRSSKLFDKIYSDFWPTYRDWREERRQFRIRAENWVLRGGIADVLAETFENARLYHDRNRAEWNFLKAVRNREQSRRDFLRYGMIFTCVVSMLLVGLTYSFWQRQIQSDENAQIIKDKGEQERKFKEWQIHQKDLERQRMADQDDLIRRVQVIRTLAEIGAARGDADLTIGLNRWEALLQQFERQKSETTKLLETLRVHFPKGVAAHAKETASLGKKAAPGQWYNSEEWLGFNGKVLQLAHVFRNELIDRNDEQIEKDLKAIRATAYERVRLCLDSFVITARGFNHFDDAAPYVREFWLNYWGDLGLVENKDVSNCMYTIGSKLKTIESELPRFAAQDNFVTYNARIKERNVSQSEVFLSLSSGVTALTDHYRLYSRMVSLGDIDEIERLTKELKDAINQDGGSVLRHTAANPP